MRKTAISFEGPIGVGKTSLGKAVAERLELGFIDGDDHSDPGHWLRSSLKTSRRIVAACEKKLTTHPAVILAYPLRRINWLYYREAFARRGIAYHAVSLTVDITSIATRGRAFTPDELERSAEMIGQGYGRRPFSDLIVETGEAGFAATAAQLAHAVASLMSEDSR